MKGHTCEGCGDTFTDEELREFREMGEAYHLEEGCFYCPDCWDDFQRLELGKRAEILLK